MKRIFILLFLVTFIDVSPGTKTFSTARFLPPKVRSWVTPRTTMLAGTALFLAIFKPWKWNVCGTTVLQATKENIAQITPENTPAPLKLLSSTAAAAGAPTLPLATAPAQGPSIQEPLGLGTTFTTNPNGTADVPGLDIHGISVEFAQDLCFFRKRSFEIPEEFRKDAAEKLAFELNMGRSSAEVFVGRVIRIMGCRIGDYDLVQKKMIAQALLPAAYPPDRAFIFGLRSARDADRKLQGYMKEVQDRDPWYKREKERFEREQQKKSQNSST